MKIVSVTPFLVAARPSSDGWSRGHTAILVKLETDDGIIGWGEAYALSHRENACKHIILSLAQDLISMHDASPRVFLNSIANPGATKHPGIDYASAVSAIEIALWDIAAKSAGLPLHALLGGAIRDKIPVYANAWDNPVQSPEAIAERCRRMRDEGYRAVKIYPLRQPNMDSAVATVRLVREAIGDEVDMMLDFAVPTDPRQALQAARAFAAYAPYWIEEPVAGDNLPALAEFRRQTDLRVTTGERQSGTRHYRDVLSYRAADVLNPDVAGVGGIITMLNVGSLADTHDVSISPHSWNSTTVAYMAMLHLCSVMPNASYSELFYDYLELGDMFGRCDSTMVDGFATLPKEPGLGVSIDEDALKELCL